MKYDQKVILNSAPAWACFLLINAFKQGPWCFHSHTVQTAAHEFMQSYLIDFHSSC